MYRFWLDMGYALGALTAGATADTLGYGGAVALVAGLTAASGVLVDMPNGPRRNILTLRRAARAAGADSAPLSGLVTAVVLAALRGSLPRTAQRRNPALERDLVRSE